MITVKRIEEKVRLQYLAYFESGEYDIMQGDFSLDVYRENIEQFRQNGKGEAGIIAVFFESLFSGKKPVIYGGIQKRDFVYVEDVARANLLALQENKSDIYNVSTGTEIDIIEIFSRINKYFKDKFEPEYQKIKKGEK